MRVRRKGMGYQPAEAPDLMFNCPPVFHQTPRWGEYVNLFDAFASLAALK